MSGDVPLFGRQLLALLLLVALSFSGASLIAHADMTVVTAVAVGLSVGAVAFLRTEFAIYLLIVAMLLSPEIAVGAMSGQREKGVTLRVDDFLLVVVGIAWFVKSAVRKELNLLADTPLNKPMYLYTAVSILSTLLGIQAGRVNTLEGVLFVLKYI